MAGSGRPDQEQPDVADDGAPLASRWPAVDLSAALVNLPVSSAGTGPTDAAAAWAATPITAANGAMIVALGSGTIPPSPARTGRRGTGDGPVPHAAFVCIGRLSDPAVNPETVPLKSAKSRTANDNFLAAASRKSVWRELFFVMLLVITIAGAFWSGRLHNFQRVIVVPGPSSFHSVVT